MASDNHVRRVATVGTGVIGSSWVALFLARGLDVFATDPAPNAEANLRRYVDTAWGTLTALGVSPKGSPEHLCFSSDLEATVAGADFIQENAPERQDLKVRLLTAIAAAAPAEAIIASSSSGVTMSVMQAACTRPDRCLIGHPVDLPHLMPLVEVVGGALTSQRSIDRAMAFYTSIGKKPIRLHKELAGHAANRMQAGLYREVAHLIDQGVLSVADADDTVSWGLGLRWAAVGPNLQFHLDGGSGGIRGFMDQFGGLIGVEWKDLGSPEFTPKLIEVIVEGVLQRVGDRNLKTLTKERDALLVALLRLRSRPVKAPGSGRARSPRIAKDR